MRLPLLLLALLVPGVAAAQLSAPERRAVQLVAREAGRAAIPINRLSRN